MPARRAPAPFASREIAYVVALFVLTVLMLAGAALLAMVLMRTAYAIRRGGFMGIFHVSRGPIVEEGSLRVSPAQRFTTEDAENTD